MVTLSKEYGAGITCHAFNADYSKIAICPNNNELHIFGKNAAGEFVVEHRLTEHDMLISGVDWDCTTNSIVTCSHDRNAFVWKEVTLDDGSVTWKPSLVILRIDKSATSVKWSPNGLKFATSCGAKCVSVCSFADEDNWWVSKTIKKHKSTVLSLAWHPNSQFLATGSTDFKCRVFSAYISKGGLPDPATPTPLLGKVEEFGEAYFEFPTVASVGWVNAVAWSPSGNILAFASHDSSLMVVTGLGGDSGSPVEQLIRFNELPLNDLTFVSEVGVVGGGHGYSPIAFSGKSGSWKLEGALEAKTTEEKKEAAPEASGAASARAMFQKMNLSNQAPADKNSKKVDNSWKQHQSAITCLLPSGAPRGSTTFPSVSTTGMDGRLVMWDLTKSKVSAASLGL
jgi:actin related protein 2/3 complex subunit 1A/1B